MAGGGGGGGGSAPSSCDASLLARGGPGGGGGRCFVAAGTPTTESTLPVGAGTSRWAAHCCGVSCGATAAAAAADNCTGEAVT